MKTFNKNLIFFSILLISFAIFAQKSIVVNGFGAIIKGNKKLAEKQAIEDGLRRALEKEIGAEITSKTVVENYQLVSDKIISKVKGYVKSYKIIKKEIKDGVITITLRVSIAKQNLKNDLQMLKTTLERMNNPRVAVMVAEQSVSAPGFNYWWKKGSLGSVDISSAENTINNDLLNKNFRVVDKSVLTSKIALKPAFQVATPSVSQVISMMKNVPADIVIMGKAYAKNRGSIAGSSMYSVLANVSLKALNIKTGQLLGSAMGNAAQVHIDPTTAGAKAIEKATKQALSKLLKTVVRSWTRNLNNGTEFTLKITNINSNEMFKMESKINSLKQVTALVTDSFGNKTATFRIAFRGNISDLSSLLNNIGLKTKSMNNGTIIVEKK
jgi:hypothetical protein